MTPLQLDEAVLRRYLVRYLEQAPVAASLWRAAEASALSSLPLAAPVLDIGCGFGEFGRIFFEGRHRPDVGTDIDAGELARAALDSPYNSLVRSDARQLPFRDARFSSVISISTLEHIPSADNVLREAARVLRTGGTLAYTVPIDQFSQNMFGYRALRPLSKAMASAYTERLNAMLTHVNIWPAERWVELTQAAGFTVDLAGTFIPPRATMAFEALLPGALGSRAWRKLTGSRPPHPAPFVRIVSGRLARLLMGQSALGSNLLVVAHT